jgi:hypothetical protein
MENCGGAAPVHIYYLAPDCGKSARKGHRAKPYHAIAQAKMHRISQCGMHDHSIVTMSAQVACWAALDASYRRIRYCAAKLV